MVVGVRRDGGGGHRLAVAGERFVGVVAEDIAEVGDRGIHFGKGCRGERTAVRPSDGGVDHVRGDYVISRVEDS